MTGINQIEFIKSRAKMNWSRAMVSDALGIPIKRFRRLCAELPEVQWARPTDTVEFRRSVKLRKGVSTPDLVRAAEYGRRVRHEQLARYSIGQTRGTVVELYAAWGDLASVTYSQVRRRLAAGKSIYDAFFLPCQMHKGWGQNNDKW